MNMVVSGSWDRTLSILAADGGWKNDEKWLVAVGDLRILEFAATNACGHFAASWAPHGKMKGCDENS